MTDMKIEVGKKYLTRGGAVVLIDREGLADRPSEFYQFIGTHPIIGLDGWRADGVYYMFGESEHDLIEEVVDEPSEFSFGPAFNPEKSLAQLLGPDDPIHYAAPPIVAADEQQFNPHAALAQALGPGAPIHYPPPTDRERAEEAQAGYLRSLVPADIATITAIEQSMRSLTASETNAVVAWFCTRYPATPF